MAHQQRYKRRRTPDRPTWRYSSRKQFLATIGNGFDWVFDLDTPPEAMQAMEDDGELADSLMREPLIELSPPVS